jgi:hypothetical protein
MSNTLPAQRQMRNASICAFGRTPTRNCLREMLLSLDQQFLKIPLAAENEQSKIAAYEPPALDYTLITCICLCCPGNQNRIF